MSEMHPNKKVHAGWKYAGALLLAIVVVIAVCEMLGWPFLKQPLERLIRDKSSRNVVIGVPFHLKLMGGIRLNAGKLQISAPHGFSEPYLLKGQNVELQLRYRDVWNIRPGDPYQIQSIRADQIDAHLTRHDDGKSTWQFENDPHEPLRPFPLIQALVIREGTAYVNDALTAADLLIRFTTTEGLQARNPVSTVNLHGEFRTHKLKGELTTQGFLPIADQGNQAEPITSKGWMRYGKVNLRFAGAVYNLLGNQIIRGQLRVQGATLGDLGDLLSITLPNTSAFKINADVARTQAGWQIAVHSAHVGSSDLYGDFIYDTRPEKSLLTGTLKGKRLVLADLAPAFGKTASGKPMRERVFPDTPLDFATYNRMNAHLMIDLDYVDLGNAFKVPITPFKADLALNKNKLSLAKIAAYTADGDIHGDIFIDAHEQKQRGLPLQAHNPDLPKPDWGIRLDVRNIDLEKWLTVSDARNAAKRNASNRNAAYITGTLHGRADLKGRGVSTAELLRTLQGEVALFIRRGEISHLVIEAMGLDIAQAFGLLVKGDSNLKMQCAVMDFNARQGVLKPEVALVDTSVTTILADGEVDMGEERLNLRVAAQPKNFSPFTVRSPLKVTGTFLNPQVSPEPMPIAARVAGGVLLAFINPLAAIVPFLDPGSAQDTTQQQNCAQTLEALKQSVKHPPDANAVKSSQKPKKINNANKPAGTKPDATQQIQETIQPH